LFGITETCTPGEPFGLMPDQYDELKKEEELQSNFYPEIDKICTTRHAKTCDDIQKAFTKINGFSIRFIDRLKMLTECNNLKNLDKLNR